MLTHESLSPDWWSGIAHAQKREHDYCFERYRHNPHLAKLHFAVRNDDNKVEVCVVFPSDDTANGIWILAEELAGGETGLERLDKLAEAMAVAAREELDSLKAGSAFHVQPEDTT